MHNFSSHFFQELLITTTRYLVLSFSMVSHIALTEFRSVGLLLPVYRLSTFSTIMVKCKIFRHTFLRNYWAQLLEILYVTSRWGPISRLSNSGLLDIYFLFTDFAHFSTIMAKCRRHTSSMEDLQFILKNSLKLSKFE